MYDYKKGLITAHEKGYRIVKGNIISPLKNIISSYIDSGGYRRFGVRINGYKNISVPVHRLVAYQKYGDEIFEDGIEVRHLDGDKLNNTDENITIGTHSQNMMDKSPEQRRKDASHPKHPHKEIIEYYKKVKSYKKTMEKFNLTSKGTLNYILKKSMENEK